MNKFAQLLLCIITFSECSNNSTRDNILDVDTSILINHKSFQVEEKRTDVEIHQEFEKIIIPIEFSSEKIKVAIKKNYPMFLLTITDKQKLLTSTDSIFFIKNLNDSIRLKGYVNDSIYYLIHENLGYEKEEVLIISDADQKLGFFGEFGIKFTKAFVWFSGSSGINCEWDLFEISTGFHIASYDMYIGASINPDILFFIYDDFLLGYIVSSNKLLRFIDFANEKLGYSFENQYWNFETASSQLKIIYKGDFKMTFLIENHLNILK